MNIKTVCIVFIACLPGCASLNQEDCLHTNWFNFGFQKGSSGEPNQKVASYQQDCSEFGIAIDTVAYQSGWDQGIIGYCQLPNAVTTGLNGQSYQRVCPANIDGLFYLYHSTAYAVYQAKQALSKLDNDLNNKEFSLSNQKLTDADRQRIRQEITALDRQRQRARETHYSRQRELEHLRLHTPHP